MTGNPNPHISPDGCDENIFRRVIFIGPTLRRGGGIASVLRSYREMLPSFRHMATNSRLGPAMSALKMAGILIWLPVIRLHGKYDILHIHGATGKSWLRKSLLIKWGAKLGFKVIYHSHGGSMKEYSRAYGREKMQRTLSRCAAIATLSSSWQKFFADTFHHRNVRKINNVVAEPAPGMTHSGTRGTFAPGNPLRLIFLGTINEKKGIFDLVETIATNASRWRGKLTLAIGGTGPGMQRLQDMISELRIPDMVKLLGWVDGDAKEAHLAEADIVILPSYIEGLPICVLEGMARAMPVIVSDVGGLPEIVENNRNGFISHPGDTRAIASAIDAYLADPTLLATHGAEGRRRATPFLPAAVRAELAALYTSF